MIRLIKSTFYKEKETKEALIRFIQSAQQLSFESQCKKFEENFANYQKRKYCVLFNSGSSANLAIVQALLNLEKIKKEDNIGFSTVTWSTNVMPLIQLGLKPVPIDVELDSLNVSSKTLSSVLQETPLKVVFLTNLLGFCDDIDEIKRICDKKNIILIEDNCEALGTIYNGKKLGNFGLASTFSFYVGHHLSTIEGGAVCTDDEELTTMLKIVRAHGWDRNLKRKTQKDLRQSFNVESNFSARYTFYDLGYNLRPTEINGFLGNCQLQYIEEIVQKRNKNFLALARKIYQLQDKYYPLKFDHIDFVSNFAVPLICRSKRIRDTLIRKCENKVEIRPIVGGDITKQPFFKKYAGNSIHLSRDSNSSIVYEQGLYFGNNPELTNNEIKELINVFCF